MSPPQWRYSIHCGASSAAYTQKYLRLRVRPRHRASLVLCIQHGVLKSFVCVTKINILATCLLRLRDYEIGKVILVR